MASLADPTVEFLNQFDDESKWLVKHRVPLFKPHERIKADSKGGKSVAYVVTAADMKVIAANMRKNQSKGVPARMTIGHVNPDHNTPETSQPQVVGYWLNAEPGTFGPENEPCVYVDAYVKRECASDVKGRPYRSAEYYPNSKEIRGAALLTRDPQLDLGTVEIYARKRGAYLYSAPGEFYMSDEVKQAERLDDVGPEMLEKEGSEPDGDEPEGHEAWKANMEHYAKRNEWVGYAMHCYQENQSSAPSATNSQIPDDDTGKAKPAASTEDMEMQRMQRDDAAVNYARLAAEIDQLKKARASDMATIASLTAERDREQCERMVRTLQAEGYQLKETTADLVAKLVKKTPEARDEWVALVKTYVAPIPTGQMIEVYHENGFEGGEKAKPKPTALDAAQAAIAARYAKGDNQRWEKARSALLAGQPLED